MNKNINKLEGVDDGVKENIITDTQGKDKSRKLTFLIFATLILLLLAIILFK